MKSIFVTSSGTEIGKTFVSTHIVRQLLARDHTVKALKPVVSDITEDNFAGSDTNLLIEAMGQTATPDTIDAVSPWRFEPALSPDMAAKREGRSIDYQELLTFCNTGRQGDHDVTLIEGVGGLMVPLDETHLVRDWIVDLKTAGEMDIVMVVGAYLGTVSHTLSTLSALAEVGLSPKLIVVSEREPGPVPLQETIDTIARFAPDQTFVGFPQQGEGSIIPDLISAL